MVDVKNNIEPNLFKATWQTLNEAIDNGFGSINYNSPDSDFLFELHHNVGLFSAFKVHRQQNDLANQLLDQNGNLRSFSQWKKAVEPILNHYNRNWLQTEYSTAVMRAREAARFKKFERDADLFPNLKWLPSTSVDKRENHIPFYGLVKPIHDPFWKLHYPGNIWNCKCGITNTNQKTTEFTPQTHYSPAPGLDENPATGKIFTKTHPYFTKAYDGAEQAVKRYEKEIEKELRQQAYETIKPWRNEIDKFNGLKIKSDNLATGTLTILRKSIDNVKEHKGTWRDILYVPKIEKKIKDWKYLGYEPMRHKKNYAEYMLIYKAKIGKNERIIEVVLHSHFGEVLYCIVPFENRDITEGLPIKK